MHGLGIPTTRALCVTGSDAPVRREEHRNRRRGHPHRAQLHPLWPFRAFLPPQPARRSCKPLADYVIDRYYPACRDSDQFAGNPYAALLQAVSERTAHMVAAWQAVGFCHGVMNTDNMSILGLTIDYGPFQFLDAFDPGHICNHTDDQGRYAYNKQPNIAYWNLFCLGQALLPLIGDQELALAALESYKTVFPAALEGPMRAKLGLPDGTAEATATLIEAILKLLAARQGRLHHLLAPPEPRCARGQRLSRCATCFSTATAFNAWMLQYSERLAHMTSRLAADLMLKTNPKFVLRNHLGEEAIQAAKLKDFSGVDTLLTLLQAPFDEHPGLEAYAGFPPDWACSDRHQLQFVIHSDLQDLDHDHKIEKTDAEWKALLAEKGAEPVAFEVTRHAATERPFTGKYEATLGRRHLPLHLLRQAELFDSATKFDAGCGWPSFSQAVTEGAIEEHRRPQPRHGAHRNRLRQLRRAPGPCVSRRPDATPACATA